MLSPCITPLVSHTHTLQRRRRLLRGIILTKCRSLYHMHPLLPQQTTAHYFPTGMHFWGDSIYLLLPPSAPPVCASRCTTLLYSPLFCIGSSARWMILLVAVPCLGCTTFYNTTTPTLTPFLVKFSLLLEVGQLLLVSFRRRQTKLTMEKQ